jgi:PhoH-like ATPase
LSRKTYILDTSTIVYDFECFEVFRGNDIIIPLKVLEELDRVKTKPTFAGSSARKAIKKLDYYFENVNPSEGVNIKNDISIKIDNNNEKDSKFDREEGDDYILSCVYRYDNSILVSKDVAMRLRAKSFGLNAQDYTNDKVIREANDVYTGNRDIELTEYYEGFDEFGLEDCTDTIFEDLFPNECVQVTMNGKNRIYRKKASGSLRPINLKKDVFGVQSRNREQAYALELLLDPEVPLVSLVGKAGSGKTLLTMAAAMESVLNDGVYKKIEVYRPNVSVGADLGYLPGSLSEKLDPWFGAIKNAIEFTLPKNTSLDEFMFMNKNKINFEAISYIRGKSLNNTFVLIDEAQNLNREELKTLITRIGYNSKCIITGDINQIDKMYLDAISNGLVYVVEKFKTSKLAGHMLLTKGERSDLATEAANIL